MKTCSVTGCKRKVDDPIKKRVAPNSPPKPEKGTSDSLQKRPELKWVKEITPLSEITLKRLTVCAKHFMTGQPGVDWVPNLEPSKMPRAVLNERDESVKNIIDNLPEIKEDFDLPDYVILDKVKFNEKKIEMQLVQKYIRNPICDENGYYNEDHDYLGLPILPIRTNVLRNNLNHEHNYCLKTRPACFQFDWRHFCNICARNCANLFSFNNHMMVHMLRNDVRCKICWKTFLTTTCLNTHLETHKALCEVCGNGVPSMQLHEHQNVNRNQKDGHREILKYKVPFKKKVHFCISCMKKFYSEKDYYRHLVLHKKRVAKGGKSS